MTHVGKEDVDLDDLGDGGTSLIEDGGEVGAALLGLVANGTLNELTLRSERDGAGAVDGVGGLDGLGLLEWLRLVI